MLPREYARRLEAVLDALDALADEAEGDDADTLEDLNAEFEDTLMLLKELRPGDEDFDEDLAGALDDLRALAGDYEAIQARVPKVAGAVERIIEILES